MWPKFSRSLGAGLAMTELGTIVNPKVADADAERNVRLEVFVTVFILVLMLRSLVLRRLLAESPGLLPGLLVPAAPEIVYSYTAASLTAGGASRVRIP